MGVDHRNLETEITELVGDKLSQEDIKRLTSHMTRREHHRFNEGYQQCDTTNVQPVIDAWCGEDHPKLQAIIQREWPHLHEAITKVTKTRKPQNNAKV